MVQRLLNAARTRAFRYGFWDGLTSIDRAIWASRPTIVRSRESSDLRARRLVRKSVEIAIAEMIGNG